MNEIKPTWKIAQEISRRHTLISLKIGLPLYLGSIVLSIFMLKLLGYAHSGLVLKHFYESNQRLILSIVTFIYFIPINFYAIMKLFNSDFKRFNLKIVQK